MPADDREVEEDSASQRHDRGQVEVGNPDLFAEIDEQDRQEHVDEEAAKEDVAAEAPLHPRADAAEDGVQPREHRQRQVVGRDGRYAVAPDGQRDREAGQKPDDGPPDFTGSQPMAGRTWS